MARVVAGSDGEDLHALMRGRFAADWALR